MAYTLTSDQNTELNYLTGVDANGAIVATSFDTWNGDTPATYKTGRVYEGKWGGGTAGTPATVSYSFNAGSNWTTVEKAAFTAALDLWSAETGLSFNQLSSGGQLTFTRTSDGQADGGTSVSGSSVIGSTALGRVTSGSVNIDTSVASFGPIGSGFTDYGGYPWTTIFHEIGHSIGLGHSGAYGNGGAVNPLTGYDSRAWTVMSYIDANDTKVTAVAPTGGFQWGSDLGDNGYYYNGEPTTPMMLDILAGERLYGLPVSTPLSGGQVFGFNSNIQGDIRQFFDFTVNAQPIVTLWDRGTGNTLDLSGYSTPSTVDLHGGAFSSVAGLTNNLGIGYGVQINTLVLGASSDTVVANDNGDVIHAGAGNDTITGGAGNDVIDGGAGTDTVILNETLLSTSVTKSGLAFGLNGTAGNDLVVNAEIYRFSDGTVAENAGNPLVDPLYYYGNNKDVWAAHVDAALHYDQFGWREGRDPDNLFSTTGYLAVNGDVRAAGIDPLQHYDQFGWQEGRDPSANFDTTLYLLHNPDVAAAHIDPLKHYLQFGQAEGRQAYAAIGTHIMADGFDPDYYLLANPDVAKAAIASGGDVDAFAFQHYETFGWKEGRNPNAWFDDKGYLAAYTDVAAAGVNPLDHYAQFGWKEGRDPSASFDTNAYLSHYTDVAHAGIDPLVHYLDYGAYEQRSTFADGIFHV